MNIEQWIDSTYMHWDAFQKRCVCVLSLLAIMWIVQLVNETYFHNMLFTMGIFPRVLDGLPGILYAPFIHGDFMHLIVNSGPYLVLGVVVALHSIKRFVLLTLFTIFVGGTMVWLTGRGEYHIGSSLLVFGYFSFLVCSGWYERSVIAISVSLLTFLTYGYLLIGLLPTQQHVSWEAHLAGFFAGAVAARLSYTKQKLILEEDFAE